MKWFSKPDKQSIKPVYQQIRDNIVAAVSEGKLQVGDSIPSINKICKEFKLAPGTVIRAYGELLEMRIISSKQGKGYFVTGTQTEQKTKIFLLFDRMNAFKEILYDSTTLKSRYFFTITMLNGLKNWFAKIWASSAITF